MLLFCCWTLLLFFCCCFYLALLGCLYFAIFGCLLFFIWSLLDFLCCLGFILFWALFYFCFTSTMQCFIWFSISSCCWLLNSWFTFCSWSRWMFIFIICFVISRFYMSSFIMSRFIMSRLVFIVSCLIMCCSRFCGNRFFLLTFIIFCSSSWLFHNSRLLILYFCWVMMFLLFFSCLRFDFLLFLWFLFLLFLLLLFLLLLLLFLLFLFFLFLFFLFLFYYIIICLPSGFGLFPFGFALSPPTETLPPVVFDGVFLSITGVGAGFLGSGWPGPGLLVVVAVPGFTVGSDFSYLRTFFCISWSVLWLSLSISIFCRMLRMISMLCFFLFLNFSSIFFFSRFFIPFMPLCSWWYLFDTFKLIY